MKSTISKRTRNTARAGANSRKRRVLAWFGLEQRRSPWGIVLPGFGLLGAGALVGIGLTVLFAPRVVTRRLQDEQARAAER
jgi:hypothetical protein